MQHINSRSKLIRATLTLQHFISENEANLMSKSCKCGFSFRDAIPMITVIGTHMHLPCVSPHIFEKAMPLANS